MIVWNFTIQLNVYHFNWGISPFFFSNGRYSLHFRPILSDLWRVGSLCICFSFSVAEFRVIFQIDIIAADSRKNQLSWTINIVPLIGTSYYVCALLLFCSCCAVFFPALYRRSFCESIPSWKCNLLFQFTWIICAKITKFSRQIRKVGKKCKRGREHST